jgi:hypothetical protein
VSFRNRRGSTPVTAEAERLNAWAAKAAPPASPLEQWVASATTEELVAWDADLQGLQSELRQLRLELRADQALSMSQQQARSRRLRELVLRVADLKQARWGD